MSASLAIPPEKECSVCHESKPIVEFPPNERGRYGVQGYCRDCQNRMRREKYASDPAFQNSQKKAAWARDRALEALAQNHPAGFTRLLNAKRREMGLRPTERPKR